MADPTFGRVSITIFSDHFLSGFFRFLWDMFIVEENKKNVCKKFLLKLFEPYENIYGYLLENFSICIRRSGCFRGKLFHAPEEFSIQF